jgi:hypothetical protein
VPCRREDVEEERGDHLLDFAAPQAPPFPAWSVSPGFFASAQGGSSVAAALLAVAAGLAAPDQLYRVELIREGERHSEHSFEARAQGTELSLLFPEGALPPGRCNARVAGPSLSRVWTYEITIDPRSP